MRDEKAVRPRTGAQILVDALRVHGADLAFGVPGESYLAVLDALYDAGNAIRFVSCRQEGGAAFMADAYGKLTGRPGICFVTRGPGACNASIGVHTALQDSTPLILFVGQVGRKVRGREAFQEVEFRQMFAPLAKWVAEIDSPVRIPEMVSRAFHIAVSGRPGPVVLALPEDVLGEAAEVADAAPYRAGEAAPTRAALEEMHDLIGRSERPVMIVGGGGWNASALEDLMAFAVANGLPTATSFRCQDYFDNHSSLYIGDAGIAIAPSLATRIRDADLVLAVGARLGEVTTQGYTLLDVPNPRQTLIHVHPGAEELGRVYQPALAINASLPAFAREARLLPPVKSAWSTWAEAARRDYQASLTPPPQPGALDMGAVIDVLREKLPEDTIVTNGAGNYTAWVHKFWRFRHYRTQLAPVSGAMGYGVPAAVAAKLVRPEARVVAFAGDGCLLMNGQELATAAAQGLDPIVLVVNNSMYGTIRMHQERMYPGRVSHTDLHNPDFVLFASSFGFHAELVERTDDFAPALDRALSHRGGALIELRIDPEGITPRTTLTAIRRDAADTVTLG
jgi:acetolactate synthase-1/2/3 large subunit